MIEPRLAELAALQSALADYDTKNGLRHFCLAQCREYTDKILQEIRKPEPDNIKLAQLAGRLDSYETFVAELEHYIKNRI